MSEVLTVWREKPGAAIATYAKQGSRTPLSRPEAEVAFLSDFRTVGADDLRTAVSSHEPFGPFYINTDVAENVLGWEAETK